MCLPSIRARTRWNDRKPSVVVFDVNETLIDIEALDPLFERMFRDGRVPREWFGQLVLYSMTSTLSGLCEDYFSLGRGLDRRKPEFDAEANTNRFLSRLPDYAAHGIVAVTICMQGGRPRYEGAVNSAFAPDGSLRESYPSRVRRVIEACDRHGLVVILGCFYQTQDQVLNGADVVRTAVANAAGWIRKCGFRNVVLEIANEFGHSGFDHPLLRTDYRQVELIRLVHKAAPGLLVSTAGLGDGRDPDKVARVADFLLIHFNGTALDDIPAHIRALKKYGKPIVCNEDDKLKDKGARAAELRVTHGASWGLMANEINQRYPFRFEGARDDPVVYAKLKELTSPRSGPTSGPND